MDTPNLKVPCKNGIIRQEYSNDIGDADEKILRGFIPIALTNLGFPLWYFNFHHLNENGPDFDGILKDSLKRVVIEISNFGLDSYIDLKHARSMEKSAGPAAYKIHLISFIECYTYEAREYLEAHNWHLIGLNAQVQTEQYYVSMLDKGYRIVLENYEDHLLIEPLMEGLRNILSPIYGVARGTPVPEANYPILEDFDLDQALAQDERLDDAYLEALFLTAFELLPESALQLLIDDLEPDYVPETYPDYEPESS